MKKLMSVFGLVTMVMAISGIAFAGEVVIKGSTTVLPIAQAAAEKYMEANPDTKITVSGGGSGNGIKAIIDGSTDIADASRFIKEKEVQAAIEKGVYPVPFAVAMDALLPVVHPSNPITDLTPEQLRKIYTGEIKNWKQVGGPSMAIAVVGRDTSSGTYETWETKIMGKERVNERALIAASNGAMVQTVAQNKLAIGYIGLGYLNETVKAVKVEGVMGSNETALNGKYPVSRYLYMFTNGWPEADPLNFINFILSPAGQDVVADTGYVPLH